MVVVGEEWFAARGAELVVGMMEEERAFLAEGPEAPGEGVEEGAIGKVGEPRAERLQASRGVEGLFLGAAPGGRGVFHGAAGPCQQGFGPGSPFVRAVEAVGQEREVGERHRLARGPIRRGVEEAEGGEPVADGALERGARIPRAIAMEPT